jgi:hypothetical protein
MTYDQLLVLWVERDSRYEGYLRRTLTRSQINAVIEWRLAEARDVMGHDRVDALARAAQWEPPQPKARRPWWE